MSDLPAWTIVVGKILIAILMTLPMAINRERQTRIMGLRTFPLVAAGTCAYVLIALDFIEGSDSGAQARIIQGILSGIGFVGGGAILKDKDHVRGTACAASIWAVGAIGIAIAYDNYAIAIPLTVACFCVLHFLTPLKKVVQSNDSDAPES